jgi:hypothetical protein
LPFVGVARQRLSVGRERQQSGPRLHIIRIAMEDRIDPLKSCPQRCDVFGLSQLTTRYVLDQPMHHKRVGFPRG